MFEALVARIARGLDSRGIPYMLTGGQAVLLYGEPRLTRDVDVSLGVGPENLPVVLDWVREEGWKVLVGSPKEFVGETFVLPCEEPTSGIRVDFTFTFTPYEREAVQRARAVTIGTTPVRFATMEDLVILKVVAGRPRDIEDVRSIVLKNRNLDAGFVRGWLRKIEEGEDESFVRRFEELVKSTKKKKS